MDTQLKAKAVKAAKTILPLLIGLLVLWFVFRQLDLKAVMQHIRGANYWVIALSLPFGLFGQIMRALRWELLITPLGYRPRKSNLIYSVLGSYGVNLAFPRLGEVWRCTMLSRYESIPFTKVVGTMITDRVFDTVAVATIIAIAFATNVPYFQSFFADHPETYERLLELLSSPILYVAAAVAVAVVWFIFSRFRNQRFIRKIIDMLTGIWEGIRTISRLEHNWLFVLYTILIWVGYFLYFYICFFAFPFTKDLGPNYGLIAFVMGSIAMAVPVQGGVGAWQLFTGFALLSFGLDNNQVGAFTNCVWTIQSFLFTAIYGIFGVLALPINNSRKK